MEISNCSINCLPLKHLAARIVINTMPKFEFKGVVPVNNRIIETGLSLFSFIENEVTIIYSPELDINGSGYDLNEAKASFYIALSEFFRYATAKGTLFNELKRMGWKISGRKKGVLEKGRPLCFRLLLRGLLLCLLLPLLSHQSQ